MIEEAFKKIDQDGNGELESSELRVALFEVGHADKDILEERFKELDVDRDGHIRCVRERGERESVDQKLTEKDKGHERRRDETQMVTGLEPS